MNKKLLIIGIVILFVAVASASTFLFDFPFSANRPPKADDSGSTDEGIKEVVNTNNQFAIDLYDELDKDGNLFFSPYSIYSALGMTYEGAEGQTKEEMKTVFGFPNNIRPNFAAIYNDINTGNNAYVLRTGNALWVQQDYPLLEEYLSAVEKYYGGKAANVDFINEAEKSRLTINSFIEEQTNDKIKELLPQGSIDAMTRLVLTNAIYFKGTWEFEFKKSETRERDFKVSPDETVTAQMMQMRPEDTKFNYASLDKLKVLELPYKGDKISMIILLPRQGEEFNHEKGELVNYEYSLDDIELGKLDEYKKAMHPVDISNIMIPRFEFDNKYYMKQTLSNMGMPTAFSPQADFSGMTGSTDLYISSVIHQAYVKVDEKGTEAAAATGIVMKLTSAGPSNFFIADHPFIFIIQDKETGNILFLGRVIDPT
jgi:serine protease inhibitor